METKILIFPEIIQASLMRCETPCGKSLVFRTGTAIVRIRVYRDTSPRSKKSRDLDIFRVNQPYQVLHDDIYAVLMEISVIPETEKIQFQAFAFHHPDIGDITDDDFGKIRLSGDGTKTRKLRTVEFHPVVIVLMPVFECTQ